MYGTTINGKVVWMVDKDCAFAFKYNGGYYVLDKDYRKAYEYYMNKERN